MKSILAVLVGVIGGLTIWFLGLMVFSSMFPYPIGIDLEDRKAVQVFLDSLTTEAHIINIITHALSVFAAGLLGSIINQKWRIQAGLIAVLPFMITYIYSDFNFKYPTYYVVTDVSLIIVMAFIGIFYGASRIISE